jgi:hypothetical protein
LRRGNSRGFIATVQMVFFATAREVFCDGEPIVKVFCDGKWCFLRRWRGFFRRAAERQALRQRWPVLLLLLLVLLLVLLPVLLLVLELVLLLARTTTSMY